jgi:hypothetical protein
MLPWNQRGEMTVACPQYATELLNEPDVFNLEYHPAPAVLAKQIRMIPEVAKALALKYEEVMCSDYQLVTDSKSGKVIGLGGDLRDLVKLTANPFMATNLEEVALDAGSQSYEDRMLEQYRTSVIILPLKIGQKECLDPENTISGEVRIMLILIFVHILIFVLYNLYSIEVSDPEKGNI